MNLDNQALANPLHDANKAEPRTVRGNVHVIGGTDLNPDLPRGRGRPAEYRIVRDLHLGYEVQYRRRRRIGWLPLPWLQCGRSGGMGTNSHATIEEARAFARCHARAGCIEYLGFL